MNTFTLFAVLGSLGAVAAFISGSRAMARTGQIGHRCTAEWTLWRDVFYGAVFLVIMAAPLSHGS